MGEPRLSVVVVVFDMAREAPRTLHSLAVPYQRAITPRDYEVIVVDNGSPTPLGEAAASACGANFQYHYLEHAAASPAAAVNFGVEMSRGEIVCIFIDGARLASPGLLSTALSGFALYPDPVVATLGWHLGPEVQPRSMLAGYDQAREDQLLESIDWPSDGYRLFDISVFAESSREGFFVTPPESNAVFLRRDSFRELGGYDPAFDLPGGGLVNLDFFSRALERDGSTLIVVLGEGTFHQIHGGASTGARDPGVDRFQQYTDQYRRIRDKPYQAPRTPAVYLGGLGPETLTHLQESIDRWKKRIGGSVPS